MNLYLESFMRMWSPYPAYLQKRGVMNKLKILNILDHNILKILKGKRHYGNRSSHMVFLLEKAISSDQKHNGIMTQVKANRMVNTVI